eukprot:NODE_870_length_1143_cov_80.786417_g828_i0.p1 GENE.NODE_870_length_1143_cov_80.786417_g828_i0~~NODE_870_length_1143_cov_80.786417_g828_i0.p1  ORF type:complete len:274 (-),score=65.71 NODE_870_length_1143_cov_80.786417_g828_i0:262-1083(-)
MTMKLCFLLLVCAALFVAAKKRPKDDKKQFCLSGVKDENGPRVAGKSKGSGKGKGGDFCCQIRGKSGWIRFCRYEEDEANIIDVRDYQRTTTSAKYLGIGVTLIARGDAQPVSNSEATKYIVNFPDGGGDEFDTVRTVGVWTTGGPTADLAEQGTAATARFSDEVLDASGRLPKRTVNWWYFPLDNGASPAVPYTAWRFDPTISMTASSQGLTASNPGPGTSPGTGTGNPASNPGSTNNNRNFGPFGVDAATPLTPVMATLVVLILACFGVLM